MLYIIISMVLVTTFFYLYFRFRPIPFFKRSQLDEKHSEQQPVENLKEDPITHLPAWHLFEDRIAQALKESERYQFTLGIMMVDIDEFRMVNEALGMEVGDNVLQEVAKRLQSCIRQVDSVTRMENDRFVVLLPQLAKPETIAVVAQRITQAMNEPIRINDRELFMTVCISITVYPVDGENLTMLLRNAVYAMTLAKEKGKSTTQFYQEKMHLKSQRDLQLYNSLSRDTVVSEFIIFYQPTVNIKSETILSMDALLYWQHSDIGLIGPEELFSYAVKQRKENMISMWLIKNACTQFMFWRTVGFSPSHLGFPLSVQQLESSQFIYQLSQLLYSLNFDPAWLLVEIKDSVMQSPFELLEKGFNMLAYMGVKIAIAEFGSSSFSLRYLKNLNVNYLKLHRAFVSDIVTNSKTMELMKSMLFLAKNLSSEVIVEGVETEEQKRILIDLGCTLMQGQHLAPVLSEREVVSKMVVPIS